MNFDDIIDDNINYFKTDKELTQVLENIKDYYKKLQKLTSVVDKFSYKFDFDENTKGNGYRSFVDFSNIYLRKAEENCEDLKFKRENLLFTKEEYKRKLKSYDAAIKVSIRIGECLINHYNKLDHDKITLFNDIGNFNNEITDIFNSIDHLEPFKAFFDFHVSIKT